MAVNGMQVYWDRILGVVMTVVAFLLYFYFSQVWYKQKSETSMASYSNSWPFVQYGDMSRTPGMFDVKVNYLTVGLLSICVGVNNASKIPLPYEQGCYTIGGDFSTATLAPAGLSTQCSLLSYSSVVMVMAIILFYYRILGAFYFRLEEVPMRFRLRWLKETSLLQCGLALIFVLISTVLVVQAMVSIPDVTQSLGSSRVVFQADTLGLIYGFIIVAFQLIIMFCLFVTPLVHGASYCSIRSPSTRFA